MNPSAGVAVWPRPAKSHSGRFLKLTLASAAALLLGAYLAGAFFLWSIHADPRRATLFTLSQYGYYYGERANVRRRLWGSSALALAFVGVSAGAWLLPRRRALHGDARFATHAEIAAAGLLGTDGIILGRRGRR